MKRKPVGRSALATALRTSHKSGDVAVPSKRGEAVRAFDIAHPIDAASRGNTAAGMERQRNAMRAAVEKRQLQRTHDADPLAAEQAERQRRLRVLQGTFGMWKDRDDVAKDGLQYQREARAEWD